MATLLISCATASNTIYKSPNKIDFIKIDTAKKDEKAGGLRHPYPFDRDQMRAILRSIRFNKKILLLKNVQNRELFNEGNIEFLAPYLIEGFQKAGPEQVVVASYFTRDSKSVIQDDRLTVFRTFVKEDGLHVKFTKTYAKLFGDRTTMGGERAAQEAHGLRVNLEIQPGQNRISWDPEELVFDLSHFGLGGEIHAKAPDTALESSPKKKVQKPSEPKSTRDRLKELEQLKKDEMITEKEYQEKRRELIQGL